MDPFTLIASIILFVGLIGYIGYPLFASRQQPQVPSAESSSRQLLERKEQLLAAIKELEFDRELGKLTSKDYQRLRAPLETEALLTLHQLGETDGSDSIRNRIEREILALRSGGPSSLLRCPSCQAVHHPEDRFCPQCGTRLMP